jgi:predicted PurR-regulated permease PerM
MIDPAQTALFIVIIVLTVLLVVLGVQVFYILRELRKTITKINKVLDYTESITESVSKPIASFSTLAMGLKTGATIAKLFQTDKTHKKDE